MEALIINRLLSANEERNVLDHLQDHDTELFANNKISENLSKFSKGQLEITLKEKKKLNHKIFEQTINFGERCINDDPITDLLMVENASIWHYHKFRVYFFLRNSNYEIFLINKHIEKYQRITLYTDNSFLDEYYSGNDKVKIISKTVTKRSLSLITIFKYGSIFLSRSFIALFQYQNYKNRQHIIVDHSVHQKVLSSKSLKTVPSNHSLLYLFEKIDRDFVILDDLEIPKLDSSYKSKTGINILIPRKNRLFGELMIFRGLLSSKVRKELKKYAAELTNTYTKISEDKLNPNEELILRYIKSLHSSSKLYLFKYFSYRLFFIATDFKTISSIDENNARLKSILDAAKYNKIKTFGIQHGVFNELQPAYNYTEKDMDRAIVPDFTFVWGPFWKKELILNGKYKEETVIITGQLRTDIIPILKKNKDFLKFPLKIKANHLIVFASQPQPDQKLRKQAAVDVFNAVKENKDIFLLVKLHPAEKHDFDYYHNLAKQTGCSNYKLILDIDLYQLLSKTDVLITCFSTVGAEAIYFNKPFISLDYLNEDLLNYYTEGIAFKAINGEELKECIDNILNGKLQIDKNAHQRYIEKYAYNIDGKVADRIIEKIKQEE